MITFKILLLSHLLGDFPLQTNRIFRMKLSGHKGLALHVAIHLIVAIILIQHAWHYAAVILFLGVSHYITDWIKVRLQPIESPQFKGFVIDQIVHLLVIGLIAWWTPDLPSVLPVRFLLPAIVITAVPALLMTGWVWANDMCQAKKMTHCKYVRWACRRLLPISQQVGWIVACFVLVLLVFPAI
ncbi:MAG: DUF3307 domain-containing protein [Chloroflexi bacterium]|nr:MAG: DUF3307 domain-containing protein [Chloroflexota bacterium]